MRENSPCNGRGIAYFIDFSIQEIPSIVYIAYETGGTIYTDSERTYRFLTEQHPTLSVSLGETIAAINAEMVQNRVKVIVYPDYHIRYFRDLPGVKHVQVFHGPNDKKYNYVREVMEYDLFLIPGNDAYERYRKKGLLKRKTGVMIGYPKLDMVFRGELKQDEELKKIDLDPKNKTVLYAPTWHDMAMNSSWNKFRNAFVKNIPQNLNLLVKPHPNIVRDRPEEMREFRERLLALPNTRLFETTPDTVPLMAASDLLIGDVSGITREYLAFRRPFVFLSNKPKILWLRKKTRLWECGEVVFTPNEVWKAVERSLSDPDRYLDKIERFFQNTFHKPDGKAAMRARDAIARLI